MSTEILKQVHYQKLLKAVLRLCGTHIHSIVSFPREKVDQWEYVIRFDPNGIQDIIPFVPDTSRQDYDELVRIIALVKEITEAEVISSLLSASKGYRVAKVLS